MRILVAGSGRLGTSVLLPLLESRDHEVVGLVQNGRITRGFDRFLASLGARLLGSMDNPLRLAHRRSVPVIWLDTLAERELDRLRARDPDLLITCGFSIILDRATLSLPRVGCMNIHSSLLPRHRGPTPFTHAILSGDRESGVTYHVTEAGIDTGAIVDQFSFPLSDDDTAYNVYRKACDVALRRTLEVVDGVADRGLVGVEQDERSATYEKTLTPGETEIDWRDSAESIHRLIRACLPPVYAHFKLGKRKILIARSAFDPSRVDAAPGTVVETAPRPVIATGEGTLTIQIAVTPSPVVLPWPMPWNGPQRGDRLA